MRRPRRRPEQARQSISTRHPSIEVLGSQNHWLTRTNRRQGVGAWQDKRMKLQDVTRYWTVVTWTGGAPPYFAESAGFADGAVRFVNHIRAHRVLGSLGDGPPLVPDFVLKHRD